MWVIVLQRVALQLLLDVLYFPLWWYGGGSVYMGRVCFQLFSQQQTKLAPLLWLKNLFVPMYGQYDWQGRIVSVFVRGANVIVRLLLVCVWMICFALVFALYLILPLVLCALLSRALFS